MYCIYRYTIQYTPIYTIDNGFARIHPHPQANGPICAIYLIFRAYIAKCKFTFGKGKIRDAQIFTPPMSSTFLSPHAE